MSVNRLAITSAVFIAIVVALLFVARGCAFRGGNAGGISEFQNRATFSDFVYKFALSSDLPESLGAPLSQSRYQGLRSAFEPRMTNWLFFEHPQILEPEGAARPLVVPFDDFSSVKNDIDRDRILETPLMLSDGSIVPLRKYLEGSPWWGQVKSD